MRDTKKPSPAQKTLTLPSTYATLRQHEERADRGEAAVKGSVRMYLPERDNGDTRFGLRGSVAGQSRTL